MVNEIIDDSWKKAVLKGQLFLSAYNLPARKNSIVRFSVLVNFLMKTHSGITNKYSFVNEIALYKTP